MSLLEAIEGSNFCDLLEDCRVASSCRVWHSDAPTVARITFSITRIWVDSLLSKKRRKSFADRVSAFRLGTLSVGVIVMLTQGSSEAMQICRDIVRRCTCKEITLKIKRGTRTVGEVAVCFRCYD